jgi:hypothetical protein
MASSRQCISHEKVAAERNISKKKKKSARHEIVMKMKPMAKKSLEMTNES